MQKNNFFFSLIIFYFFFSSFLFAQEITPIEAYKQAKEYVVRADTLFNEQQYQDAKKNYEQALVLFKNIKEKYSTWSSLVLVDIQENKCNDQLEQIKNFLPPVLVVVNSPQIELPKKEITVPRQEPETMSVSDFSKKGDDFLAKEQFKEAIECYDKNLSSNPHDEIVLANKGVALFKSGQVEKAKELFEKLTQDHPDFSPAYYNLADIYYSLGDLSLAIIFYKKAIEIDPNDMNSRLNLGIAYLHTGSYNKALDQFQTTLKYNPDDPEIHYNLGILYSDYMFDKEKAIYYYSKYLEIKPEAKDKQQVLNWIEQLRSKK